MWRIVFVGGLLSAGFLVGCSDGEAAPQGESVHPLQPLIYTEDPELTPEGAAVRERRLERQLLEGIADGAWGRLEEADATDFPVLRDEEALGEAITRALLERDEELWEYVFVDARAYAALVNVDETSAREFVDNQMGESLSTWDSFAQPHSSEAPDEGLVERIRFRELKLGSARRLDGGSADEEEDDVVQYWHNQVILKDAEAGVEFELRISRIFIVVDELGRSVFHVASEIETDPNFQVFLDAGLHLKPQLMRAREYPFPLGVGTFWRYRRFDADVGVDESADSLDQRIEDRPEGLAAEEVILEVRDVARHGPVRLVELLRSYNDRRHTRTREWWVVTPRKIYACDENCRERIDDVGWLLGYFQRRVALMHFPVQPGDGWRRTGTQEDPVFRVDEKWHDVDVPAGTFRRAFRIEGTGALGLWDPYLREAEVVRYFAPDRGVVRRDLYNSPEGEHRSNIVEELVEYRLMY